MCVLYTVCVHIRERERVEGLIGSSLTKRRFIAVCSHLPFYDDISFKMKQQIYCLAML